jgi:hypothetical protein
MRQTKINTDQQGCCRRSVVRVIQEMNGVRNRTTIKLARQGSRLVRNSLDGLEQWLK